MQQIQLSDSLYRDAQRQAAAAGFASVDEYVADLLNGDLLHPSVDDDHLFTPERIEHLDQISTSLEAGGRVHTSEQVKEHFRGKRQSWLKKDAG